MRTLFLLASVALVGCAASNTPEAGSDLPLVPLSGTGRAMAGATDEARAATTDTSLRGPGSSPVSCRDGAFCDDFESADFAASWKGSFTTGKAFVELGQHSASLGAGSLHLTTHGEDATAFLRHEGAAIGAVWSGSLSFALRVAELPAVSLGGPQLTVKTPFGPVYVRLVMTPDGVFLEQGATASCRASRCIGSRTLLSNAVPNHWYNIRIAFEVNDGSAAPYGVVATSVNGAHAVASELTVPLSQGTVFLEAGITVGDVEHVAVADVDDVSLLVR